MKQIHIWKGLRVNQFRQKRFQQFVGLLSITPETRILDAGGLPYDWLALQWPGQVLCVSLSNLDEGVYGDGNIVYRRQDILDIADDNFDVVFSNSLLEHVGRENQMPIARKIASLAPRYWVQVPYRYTPMEPHYMFPFFWLLPHYLRRKVCNNFTPLLVRQNWYANEIDTIHLLDRGEMHNLFPEAKILSERVMGLTKSLIAVY